MATRRCRRPPIYLLLIILISPFEYSDASNKTTKLDQCELSFNSKQSMGYEQGTQLQVCCNVSSVSLWEFEDPTAFKLSNIAFQQEFSTNEGEIWSELQLSKCTDRPGATIGYVDPKPGVNCTYMIGQTLNIPQKSLKMPEWYVICFQKSSGCQSCRLDVICENDLSSTCSDINVIGSATTSTNSSIKYWYTVGGDFPFVSVSTVEISITRQRTSEITQTNVKPVKAGQKEYFTFTDLHPAEWYLIKRCLTIHLPVSLSQSRSLTFQTLNNTICHEEAYRTENLSNFTILFIVLIISIANVM